MEIWFTSDDHFNDKSIIEYCGRPFVDVLEMNERLIDGWNAFVRPQDHVYNLGDLCMERPRNLKDSVFKRLNGHKRLIRGNHDIYKTKEYLDIGFEEIYGVRVIDNFIFTHIPIHPRSMGRFRANIHGHIHNNQGGEFEPVMRLDKVSQQVTWVPYINVSVEATKYHPVNLEWIREQERASQLPWIA
jgi:calcineurin-like phosphoesterase family protein